MSYDADGLALKIGAVRLLREKNLEDFLRPFRRRQSVLSFTERQECSGCLHQRSAWLRRKSGLVSPDPRSWS